MTPQLRLARFLVLLCGYYAIIWPIVFGIHDQRWSWWWPMSMIGGVMMLVAQARIDRARKRRRL